jgi:hypothetical protein
LPSLTFNSLNDLSSHAQGAFATHGKARIVSD